MSDAEAVARDDSAKIIRGARVGLTALLILLGFRAFRDPLGYVPLLSEIDLAIHEFGHMLFMPFGVAFLGRTMVILGGSLFQVLVPLIFAAYFCWPREGKRDVHAAMACLWWTSINILNVAIYAADSRAGQLMLVNGQTGQESDAHDWNNLLTIWHALDRDTVIAARMRGVALLLFVASSILGLWTAVQSTPDIATEASA